ncbi:energy transducer TonB [Bacteroides coprosuis]|uniref:energy transducer TonB n=1 Tax=Bacteroides coprosuis TaxID=151276 RepID=UPI001DB5DAE8|nr:energy transducer TonB [Bacteroides coprosuis]HJD91917.1 TonB family protein [Bacteroides coprosuis]
MKKNILATVFASLLIMCGNPIKAQSISPIQEYTDQDVEQLTALDTITEIAGLKNGEELIYVKNKLKSVMRFKNGVQVGSQLDYYDNGQLFSHIRYNGEGVKEGPFTLYHSNGKSYYTSFYKEGVENGKYYEYSKSGALLKKGECIDGVKTDIPLTDSDKKEYTSTDKQHLEKDDSFQTADYRDGGINGLMNFIKRNIKYPVKEQRLKREGKVVIALRINKKGEMDNFYIQKSENKTFDEEALRVVKLIPNNWCPAMKDNKPVNTLYYLPINFRLR